MSTFKGLVPEFPDIRIDFFRHHADRSPPLACFLSHVHSDHLAGLEQLRSPFVYCSPATRAILLQLERYPCRINYAKGILEARKLTYKHLSKVLKAIPLATPTVLELRPGSNVQVTLLDANHCPGSVMFLIEGDGKSILYTGDVRCEPWFVNSLARNPNAIEFTAGLKTLDRIYLDTSFTGDTPFQTKAQGLKELLQKVSRYPHDTVFHFQAWTYGYEDVWLALSKALNSKIHVDDYKLRVYRSLSKRGSVQDGHPDSFLTPEAAALAGYMCGNLWHEGCLTGDETVRIHSCERSNMCAKARGHNVVHIQPLVARIPEGDIREIGAGGGGDDLERVTEFSFLSKDDANLLMQLFSQPSVELRDATISQTKLGVISDSLAALQSKVNIAISDLDDELCTNLDTFKESLQRRIANGLKNLGGELNGLSRTIRFPYARHSSYPEICEMVDLFKPKDVWPCTEDLLEWRNNGLSIQSLFGRHCSGSTFAYDILMEEALPEHREEQPDTQRSSSPTMPSIEIERSTTSPVLRSPPRNERQGHKVDAYPGGSQSHESENVPISCFTNVPMMGSNHQADNGQLGELGASEADGHANEELDEDSQMTRDSVTSTLGEDPSILRQEAYWRMLKNSQDDGWECISLLSTTGNHVDETML